MTSFYIKNISMQDESFDVLKNSLKRYFDERMCVLADADTCDYTFSFCVDGELTNDKYVISPSADTIAFTAANSCSLHAAAGRFLAESKFDGLGGFNPYTDIIEHEPLKSIRGMYFATHFHNFYHDAPLERIYEVIDDLALRNCNALLVWYDMHHFTSLDSAESQELIKRLKAIMSYGKKIGMKIAMTMLANEGFSTSPAELRASFLIQNGYHTQPAGRFECEICPSVPGGMEEILRERREMLEAFADVSPDFLTIWPYDQGGCTCAKCAPWGANGYLKIIPEFEKLAKEIIPSAEIILSTWFFDSFVPGEWELFYEKFSKGEVGNFKYIMSYFRNGELPECIRRNGIPKDVKFIEFPEISMYPFAPWGGCGANPFGKIIDCTNSGSGFLYDGGFPYSEGIYEDINKFIQLSYYSGEAVSSHDAIRRYVNFEFCCDDEELSDAIERTEKALVRKDENNGKERKYIIEDSSDVDYVYNVLTKYNNTLPVKITAKPKWRMVYLRAVIDYEILHNNFKVSSENCKQAMRELCTIYCASNRTNPWVHPPVDEFENAKLIVEG